jgi:hypothetical protein
MGEETGFLIIGRKDIKASRFRIKDWDYYLN